MPRPKPPPQTAWTLRIDRELVREIDASRRRKSRSRNAWVRELIEERLGKRPPTPPPSG